LIVAIAALCFGFAACQQAPATGASGTYQDALRTMEGEEFDQATGTIAREWKFEVASSWAGGRPSPEELRKLLEKKLRFTDEEIGSLFAENGRYSILVFLKKTGSEQASVGAVDSMGMPVSKDLGSIVEKYDAIRALFRDGRLVQGRLWSGIERAGGTSGGLIRRRG
jgi:hypothetical protein